MDTKRIVSEFSETARPLVESVLAGRVSDIQGLVRAGGTDPSISSITGLTPLYLAVTAANERAVKVLLAIGADPNGDRRRAPIHAAIGITNPTILTLLLGARADPNGRVDDQPALSRAALIGNLWGITALLEAGANVDQPNSVGVTPCLEAAAAGNWQVVEKLLAAGAHLAAASQGGVTIGLLAHRSRIASSTIQGQARQRIIGEWQRRGLPWPPPDASTTRNLKDSGRWPPR